MGTQMRAAFPPRRRGQGQQGVSLLRPRRAGTCWRAAGSFEHALVPVEHPQQRLARDAKSVSPELSQADCASLKPLPQAWAARPVAPRLLAPRPLGYGACLACGWTKFAALEMEDSREVR